jgi:hypothetical protein
MQHIDPDPAALIDELVAAHYDTVEIALATGCDTDDWAPHLTYLQELARATRGVMAAAAGDAFSNRFD